MPTVVAPQKMAAKSQVGVDQQQGGRLQDESDMSGFACLLLGVGLSLAQVDKLELSFTKSDLSKVV